MVDRDRVQALALRASLSLEIKGLKRRGRSAYSITKEKFGFKGNRKHVLEQLNRHIEEEYS